MPTELIMKKTRKTDTRPFHVDLRVTWPDELEDELTKQFALTYRDVDPRPQDSKWHEVGTYVSKADAQLAAENFTNNSVNSDEWAADET